MKPFCGLLLLLLLGSSLFAQPSRKADSLQILSLRQASNRAFQQQDIPAILEHMTTDLHVTTGIGFMIQGKDSLHQVLLRIFQQQPDIYFRRTPETIVLNSAQDRAWEQGNWQGFRPQTPTYHPSHGRYAAMWVRNGNRWQIQSELFVSLD